MEGTVVGAAGDAGGGVEAPPTPVAAEAPVVAAKPPAKPNGRPKGGKNKGKKDEKLGHAAKLTERVKLIKKPLPLQMENAITHAARVVVMDVSPRSTVTYILYPVKDEDAPRLVPKTSVEPVGVLTSAEVKEMLSLFRQRFKAVKIHNNVYTLLQKRTAAPGRRVVLKD